MRSVLASLALFALCTACSGSNDGLDATEDMLTSADPRPFDVAALRDHARKTFATPSGSTEICLVAAHFSEDGFTEKDAKKEDKLCRLDFNTAPQDGVIAAGLAPKANSTNPATDVHEVTGEIGRDVVESFEEANARDRRADKLGRLKSSLDGRFSRTATYAPSILGYYGTSRMLGNIAEVTPAVWRTLEVSRHAKVAELGQRLTVVGSQVVKTMWAVFGAADAASSKTALTYTKDGTQLYGALIPSVGRDDKDHDIDTLDKLTRSERFRTLIDARPLASFVATDFKSAVAAIVPMQGVTEMLVLDAIMLQGDRLSGDNVSFLPFVYFQKPDGSVDRMTKKDHDDLGAAAPADAVDVRKLYLNDVDAGLIVKSAESFQGGGEFAQLKKVAHIAPDLYARVRKLSTLTNDQAFQTLAKTEWRYTDRDWARYKAMADAVAASLHDRCSSGALLLDLDLAKHVAKTSLGPRQGCDGSTNP